VCLYYHSLHKYAIHPSTSENSISLLSLCYDSLSVVEDMIDLKVAGTNCYNKFGLNAYSLAKNIQHLAQALVQQLVWRRLVLPHNLVVARFIARHKKQRGSFSMLTSRLLTGIWYFYWKILSSKLFSDDKTCESHRTYSMFILAYQNMQKHAIKQCKIVQFYAKREKDTSKWVPNTTWWEVFCVSHQKQRRRPMLWESYNVVTFKWTNTNLNRHI
jgi:hypothetical protein